MTGLTSVSFHNTASIAVRRSSFPGGNNPFYVHNIILTDFEGNITEISAFEFCNKPLTRNDLEKLENVTNPIPHTETP